MRKTVRLAAWLVLVCLVGAPLLAQAPPRVVHVFVALADNEHQGIIPVPKRLGNGLDPENNLYWGAAFGVKAFFAHSSEWKLLSAGSGPKLEVLERCIFKHRSQDVYLVADAYRGDQIRQAIVDFLKAAAGTNPEKITVKGFTLSEDASLVAYIGHEGLMDFQLSEHPRGAGGGKRQAIILACLSKSYFAARLRAAGAEPLLWTTGLMAPEAYTLKDALDGWVLKESDQQIRERAAAAYDRYQKCGLRASRRLLVTGW